MHFDVHQHFFLFLFLFLISSDKKHSKKQKFTLLKVFKRNLIDLRVFFSFLLKSRSSKNENEQRNRFFLICVAITKNSHIQPNAANHVLNKWKKNTKITKESNRNPMQDVKVFFLLFRFFVYHCNRFYLIKLRISHFFSLKIDIHLNLVMF